LAKEKIMRVNEGITDRTIRIAVGLILLSLVFVGPRSLWGLVGLIPLATGLFGVCPAYSVLGINTCKAR
jgi:hypothetical protein